MLIVRKNPFTGNMISMELPITDDQLANYGRGTLVQNAFPNLNADQREFFMTGITPDQWDDMFPEEDDE